ncbi:GNAT family N-acetyltransferase [Nguyenibacter vanlangensis]|uniref:GNAT family N-acetyltransferase n=1 Tax=Nguyenibacter vanlangensis TaxID=1216886 RepID=A0A7Y7IUT5_9PROT|nr:GNAT family N-acetyltransferase [Nguyenibacter vanlangensis]NVN10171.1 GNAT family N-acetyltransferase [Nguyenibacter vanlangensis]
MDPCRTIRGQARRAKTIEPSRFHLRPQCAADMPFLLHLYGDVRRAELDATGWPELQRHAFLNHQFLLQTHHYRTYYPAASFDLIEVADAPAGRLYVDEGQTDCRIIDISLLATHRNLGLGGAVLRQVVTRATVRRKTVSLHVMLGNPAIRLYRRMGFQVIDPSDPMQILMRCAVGPGAPGRIDDAGHPSEERIFE